MKLLRCLLFSVQFIAVFSHCQSGNSSRIWICDALVEPSDYQRLLNDEQQIEQFFLTRSTLQRFHLEFYPLTLRLINASGNRFASISFSSKLRNQSNLRQLILPSNQLTHLDLRRVFFPFSLEEISLANNLLQILDARLFARLTKLIHLDLRNNLLKQVSPWLTIRLNVLLDQNPLDCHCTKEPYRSICQSSTRLPHRSDSTRPCVAPHVDTQLALQNQLPSYVRFSTTVLLCPIRAEPPGTIIWSTPFGNLTSANSSEIDLLIDDGTLYRKLVAIAGPWSTRTKHTLQAFDNNSLSISRTRAALNHRLSCSAVTMLGMETYEFDFQVDSFVKRRALWELLYTFAVGLLLSLIGGATCLTLKQTRFYPVDQIATPPIYPTMTPNSAARTPPNFEFNQWFSSAAANISDTLEQVRDKLRQGVQQVSEQMGQTMGRASELITQGVQTAGGTIRQAATTSAAYLRETSQQALTSVRDQTLSSLRNSSHFMRARMNIITSQMNSLRDYCGVTTGLPMQTNYLAQQPYAPQSSPSAISRLQHHHQITSIPEDEESPLTIDRSTRTPYAGFIASQTLVERSAIGELSTVDNSVLLALNNFEDHLDEHEQPIPIRGQLGGGIGTFQTHMHEHGDDSVQQSEHLIVYSERIPSNQS